MFESSSGEFQAYMGSIDQKIEITLWQLAIESKKDVASELTTDFDFETLRITRDTLFARAKEKAQRTIMSENGRENPNDAGVDWLENFVDPWRMINRRLINLMGLDVCDLYLYATDMTSEFPSKLLRRKTLLCTSNVEGGTLALLILPENANSRSVENQTRTETEDGAGYMYEGDGNDTRTDGHSRSNRDERPAKSFILFGEHGDEKGGFGSSDDKSSVSVPAKSPGGGTAGLRTMGPNPASDAHACTAPAVPSKSQLNTLELDPTELAPDVDISTKDCSRLSQASFVRDILEVHDRIVTSSPTKLLIVEPPKACHSVSPLSKVVAPVGCTSSSQVKAQEVCKSSPSISSSQAKTLETRSSTPSTPAEGQKVSEVSVSVTKLGTKEGPTSVTMATQMILR